MKKADVQVGKTYLAKVSNRVVPVQLMRASEYGGWIGRNTLTGREVRIKSAAKLRCEYVEDKPKTVDELLTDAIGYPPVTPSMTADYNDCGN